MNKKINYAVLGCGHVANRVADGILKEENSRLYSFASRSESGAKEYKEKYNSINYYSSYEEMLVDENIDVVYYLIIK